METYIYIFSFILTFIASGYALIKFFKPHQAIYKKMIACAVVCFFLVGFYELVQYLNGVDVPFGFYAGFIGIVSAYSFIFSANYGAMDSLIDDRSKKLEKYRIIALLAPIVGIQSGIIILLSDVPFFDGIWIAIEQTLIGCACYFNLKHLIIPKRYADIFVSLRPYNLVVLLMALAIIVENINWYFGLSDRVGYICVFIEAVMLSLIAPLLERGIKKWST